MRKLISLQQLLDWAEIDGIDPHDLAIDEDDVFDLGEVNEELEENPEDEE
jgi:hypothetical protein